ncbi:39S ribosomal protein L28, mitochondrial [Zygosaccharomyces mellis]|uniref:Large ribosomal subunit protein mL40 n=1 Tax=Zygosaccharomyces mellis TaxID=42258 RepID=A0A4C2E181_9SACH|nr:39S ribosomal protein L28, mitochondrial [Zygosaccharomyces mellis]
MTLPTTITTTTQSIKNTPITNSLKLAPLTLTRGKRTKSKGTLPPLVQRAVTQLSVLSASRKQPKLLKVSREDFIKHQTIHHCWSIYQKELREKRNVQLKLQYKSTKNAMDILQQLSPKMFEAANVPEDGKRFPMELKVPTEFPPNKLWNYTFKKD